METRSSREGWIGRGAVGAGESPSYRWVVLAVFGFALFTQALLWLTFAPLETATETALGVGHFSVRLLALVDPIAFIVLAAGAGLLADRRGFRFTVTLGLLLMAPAAVGRAVILHLHPAGAALYYPLLAMQIILSVGAVCCVACILQMPVKWFPASQRAKATGLTSMSLLLGNAVVFPLAAGLGSVPAAATAREAQIALTRVLDVFAAITLVAAAAFLLLVKSDPVRVESASMPDRRVVRQLFRLPDFRAIALLFFWGLGLYGGLMVTMEKMMRFHGFDVGFAAVVGGGLTFGGILGTLVLPSISDRLGLRRPFIYAAALLTLPCTLALAFWGLQAIDLVAALLLGFFLLAAQPIIFTMLGEMDDVGPGLAGTAVGAVFAFGSFGQVLLPLFIELFRRQGAAGTLDYRWSILILGALGVIGFLFIMRSIPETGPGGKAPQRSKPVTSS